MSYSVLQRFRSTTRDPQDDTYYILATPATQEGDPVAPSAYLYSPNDGLLAITLLVGGVHGTIPTTYVRATF